MYNEFKNIFSNENQKTIFQKKTYKNLQCLLLRVIIIKSDFSKTDFQIQIYNQINLDFRFKYLDHDKSRFNVFTIESEACEQGFHGEYSVIALMLLESRTHRKMLRYAVLILKICI